jgi:thymidine kinase
MGRILSKKELLELADKINYEQWICIECGDVFSNELSVCHCDNDE